MSSEVLEIAPFPRRGKWWRVVIRNLTSPQLQMSNDETGPWEAKGSLSPSHIGELMIIAAHQGCEQMKEEALSAAELNLIHQRYYGEPKDPPYIDCSDTSPVILKRKSYDELSSELTKALTRLWGVEMLVKNLSDLLGEQEATAGDHK